MKQSFAYNVFNTIVQFDEGRTIVREYEVDYNAQKVYERLLHHATESTSAELTKDKLTQFLSTGQLDSLWHGSTEGFLVHWQAQMRQYEDMTAMNEHYTDATKKRMLINAVQQVTELRNVRTIDEQRVAVGEPALSYRQYVDLLKSAAVQRDHVYNVTTTRSRRTVNYAGTGRSEERDENFPESYLDCDTSNFYDTPREVNRTLRSAPPRTAFAQQTTPASNPQRHYLEKRLWDQLPDETKRALSGVPMAPAQNQPMRVQLHAMTFDDDDPIANLHTNEEVPDDVHEPTDETTDGKDNAQDPTALLAHITQRKSLPHDHGLRAFLAQTHSGKPTKPTERFKTDENPKPKESMVINGKRYVQANMHTIAYQVATAKAQGKHGSLIDRGANGGLAGSDVRLIGATTCFADVSSINDHTISSLLIGTVAGVITTHLGPVCAIMHQYACHDKGYTIHSCVQMEHYGLDVNDRAFSTKGGCQAITTPDGYVIPLSFQNGLPYLDMHPPSDEELAQLPHVVLTANTEWDPTVTDVDLRIDKEPDELTNRDPVVFPTAMNDSKQAFEAKSNYRLQRVFEVSVMLPVIKAGEPLYNTRAEIIANREIKDTVRTPHATPKEIDFNALRPHFTWLPTESVKWTFETTPRWARATEHYSSWKHVNWRFPTLSDTTPATDNVATIAQRFDGTKSMDSDVFVMKTDNECVQAGHIQQRGAMVTKISTHSVRYGVLAKDWCLIMLYAYYILHCTTAATLGFVDFGEAVNDRDNDWFSTVYGEVTEVLPPDAAEPLDKPVRISTFEDADTLITGRAVTGVLHFLKGPPVDWCAKRHDTVETATHSSAFIAACIATEVGRFVTVPGKVHTADGRSKHCGCALMRTHLKPLLFGLEDTTEGPDTTQQDSKERVEL